MSSPVPWREAWEQALYGADGFYRRPDGPAGHFLTATHGGAGAVLAETLWGWADRLGADGIVDVGAGRGELLRHLYAAAPHRPLAGLDVVARPPDLPDRVGWSVSPGGAALPDDRFPRRSLVVAHEWLDVVPCTVGEVDQEGRLRQVLVDPAGTEHLGGPLDEADLAWCQRFWPAVVAPHAPPGDRVEVGRSRDSAWSGLLDRLDGGAALAVDYGHTADERPATGTLTAYRSGRQVEPLPDGSCDLTAHVAVDALRQTDRCRQRDAVAAADRPDRDMARRDPAAYLADLARGSDVAALRRPGGFGDFWWVTWAA
ncbi:MAG: SAM-dependent methyltransferase [Lapillicoccus sp.]